VEDKHQVVMSTIRPYRLQDWNRAQLLFHHMDDCGKSFEEATEAVDARAVGTTPAGRNTIQRQRGYDAMFRGETGI
jgi:hypothetical protein